MVSKGWRRDLAHTDASAEARLFLRPSTASDDDDDDDDDASPPPPRETRAAAAVERRRRANRRGARTSALHFDAASAPGGRHAAERPTARAARVQALVGLILLTGAAAVS